MEIKKTLQIIPQLPIKFYEHNANKTIPKAIVEEWEKVKESPAFVGLFYLSANHIKFTYLIKD